MNMNIVNTLPLLSTDNTKYKASARCDDAAFSQLFQDSKQTVANGNGSSKKESVDVAFDQCISGQAIEGIDHVKLMVSDNEKKAGDEDDENSGGFFTPLAISSDLKTMSEHLLDKPHQNDKFLTAAIRGPLLDFTGTVAKKLAGDLQWSKINKKGEIIDGIVQTFSQRGVTTDKCNQSSEVEVFQQTAMPSVNQEVQPIMPAASYLNMPMSTAAIPTSMLPVAVGNAEWLASLTERIIFFNRNEIQKAEICLHPEEFGSLHIQLAMQHGKMHLNVVAMHSRVKSVLESALPYLRTSLIEQGIALQDMHVSDLSSTAWHGNDASLFNQSSHTDSTFPDFLTDENDELVNTEKILPSSTQSGMSVFV